MLQFPHWSSWLKVAGVLLPIATILNIIAYSTKAWIVYEAAAHGTYDHWGVYSVCKGYLHVQEDCFFIIGADYPAWYKAVQGVGSVGLVMLFTTLVILIMYMCLPDLNDNKNMRLLLLIACFLSSLFCFMAVILYGSKWLQLFDTSRERAGAFLSWSYGFACIAVVFDIIAAIMVLVDFAKHADDDAPPANNFFL